MTSIPTDLRQHLCALLQAALPKDAAGLPGISIALERPRQAQHGDYACNIAMQLAKPLRRSPRDIAQGIIAALPVSPWLDRAEVAGAGFINLYLRAGAKQSVVRVVLEQGAGYGRAGPTGRKVQVEFVSANPTGPLHVGHGRGAAYGASLANILAADRKSTRLNSSH